MNPRIKPGLRLLLIAESLVLLAGAMIGPIQAIFVQRLGGDLLDASYAGAIFSFAAGITTLIAGRYADSHPSPKHIIIWGYAMMAFGFLLFIFVQTVWQLLLVQILIGIATPFYTPAFNALYTRHINLERAGFEWSLWDATDYFMTAVGALAGGAIVFYFGFNAVFITMSTICLISVFYLWFSHEEKRIP